MFAKRNNTSVFVVTIIVNVVVAVIAIMTGMNVYAQESAVDPAIATSEVYKFSDNTAVEGAFSHLYRSEKGVTTVISTSELNPGEVYTLWWVIFNNPENCSEGACNLDDIFVVENGVIPRDEAGNRVMNMDAIATANVSVLHAAGGYAVDDTFNTSASLSEGEGAGILFGAGLVDAETSEIHLVVRTHGAKDIATFAEQLSSFGGGCEPMDAAPCDDVQYAYFMPVN